MKLNIFVRYLHIILSTYFPCILSIYLNVNVHVQEMQSLLTGFSPSLASPSPALLVAILDPEKTFSMNNDGFGGKSSSSGS